MTSQFWETNRIRHEIACAYFIGFTVTTGGSRFLDKLSPSNLAPTSDNCILIILVPLDSILAVEITLQLTYCDHVQTLFFSRDQFDDSNIIALPTTS